MCWVNANQWKMHSVCQHIWQKWKKHERYQLTWATYYPGPLFYQIDKFHVGICGLWRLTVLTFQHNFVIIPSKIIIQFAIFGNFWLFLILGDTIWCGENATFWTHSFDLVFVIVLFLYMEYHRAQKAFFHHGRHTLSSYILLHTQQDELQDYSRF